MTAASITTVLVTGATGYVAIEVVKQLLEKVRIYINL